MRRTALCLLPFAALACGAPSPRDADALAQDATAARFVDLEEWASAQGPASADAYWQARRQLKAAFDDRCGDTFCEGDYSNLEALSFRCSVEKASGALGQCLWTFAGSWESVAKSSGAIQVHHREWRCAIPARGPASELLRTLGTSSSTQPAIDRPLPGGARSAYDALIECL